MAHTPGSGAWGLLPAVGAGTAIVFYVIWAAMHDIAHEEADTTAEWAALAVSVPAFAFLYRSALSRLTMTERIAWLSGTALLVGLFTIGAFNAMLHPKYAMDPTLARLFLLAGVPVLGLIGYHLFNGTLHLLRTRRGAGA